MNNNHHKISAPPKLKIKLRSGEIFSFDNLEFTKAGDTVFIYDKNKNITNLYPYMNVAYIQIPGKVQPSTQRIVKPA